MKTFILGVGAQKAGSTWLFKYLNKLPGAIRPFYKEFHIWNALEIPECLRWKYKFNPDLLKTKYGLRMLLQKETEIYFHYFDELLIKQNGNLTYDITPCYAGLNASTLKHIYDNFKKREINCKVIFIARDPIDRCWSAVKYFQKKYHNTPDKYKMIKDSVDPNIKEEEALRLYSKSKDAQFRTAYELTIKNLQDVFPKENIFIGIFEKMFDQTFEQNLNNFLNVKSKKTLIDKKINTSTPLKLQDEKLMREIAIFYSNTYSYFKKNFPETRDLWGGFKYL